MDENEPQDLPPAPSEGEAEPETDVIINFRETTQFDEVKAMAEALLVSERNDPRWVHLNAIATGMRAL